MSTTSSKRPSNVSLPDLNVSLEPHLVRDLVPLLSLLPDELASELNSALKDRIPHGGEPSPDDPRQETSLISYRLLYSISVWARSPHGATALSSHIPVLDTNQYTMIALLAGTKTSPERKFPTTNTWSRDHEAEAKRELSDRRAVVAVLNALLSILGSGAATWWAAEKLQWRDEWKVLLALAAAIIVAASEGILYLIWNSRRSKNFVRPSVSRSSQEMKMAKKVIEATSNPATPDELQDPAVDSLVTSSPNLRLHHDNNSLRERTRKSGSSQEEG
ncbi:hypothetical protein NLI96_g1977 [Meripilus lineatus]|uniref:Uncharacterized protein n=1 Tax=Meripilus lineatus TaxID=2056292 RepID=A0AAD5V9F8_9APHY|nr:hypothetical protein NLI96_g1977 [Physisporinus lineatus]